jgi:hypothetical protein
MKKILSPNAVEYFDKHKGSGRQQFYSITFLNTHHIPNSLLDSGNMKINKN